MSHSIHPNQLCVLLAEDHEETGNSNISRALRFLETMDTDEETLRLRRRRAQRAAGSIAGFTAARAALAR